MHANGCGIQHEQVRARLPRSLQAFLRRRENAYLVSGAFNRQAQQLAARRILFDNYNSFAPVNHRRIRCSPYTIAGFAVAPHIAAGTIASQPSAIDRAFSPPSAASFRRIPRFPPKSTGPELAPGLADATLRRAERPS